MHSQLSILLLLYVFSITAIPTQHNQSESSTGLRADQGQTRSRHRPEHENPLITAEEPEYTTERSRGSSDAARSQRIFHETMDRTFAERREGPEAQPPSKRAQLAREIVRDCTGCQQKGEGSQSGNTRLCDVSARGQDKLSLEW